MPPTILTLPRELSQQIIGQLPFHDKVRLSAACKEYRTYLAPEIFSTIHFTSQEKSAESALAAVKAHGKYTTCIEFMCQAYSDELPPSRLPLAAIELLTGRHMPNLHAARLDFDFDFIPFSDFWLQMQSFAEPGDDEAQIRAVQLSNWQAKECETWRALSLNHQIKALTVDHFNPATNFRFNSDESRNFLARLESVDLTVWKPLNDKISDNTLVFRNYLDFFKSKMDSLLLCHMQSLKHLEIWAPATSPRGYDSQYDIRVGLMPGTLPALQSLKLVNGTISRQLISFIRDHAHSLKSLDLGKCVAKAANSHTSWATFFDQIYEANLVL